MICIKIRIIRIECLTRLFIQQFTLFYLFLFLFILCIVAFVRLLRGNMTKQACVFGCFIAGFIVFSMFEYAWGVGSLSFLLFFFLLYFAMRSKDISQEEKDAIEIDGNDN